MSKKSASNSQVFISYAHEDLASVQRLYEDLTKYSVNVWFDKVSMSPGLWKPQIDRAISRSRFFIICLSESALRKTGDEPGFQDLELQQAYEIARVQDPNNFTIIPIRFEDCGRGDHRLSVFQQYDLFNDWQEVVNRLVKWLGGNPPQEESHNNSLMDLTDEEKLLEGLSGKALVFFYAQEYESLVKTVETILLLKPKNSDALGLKALALEGLGCSMEALEIFDQALTHDPSNISVLTSKAVSLAEQGENEEALEIVDKALSLSPSNVSALWLKSGLLRKLNQHKRAVEVLDKALVVDPNHTEVMLTKGIILAQLKQFKDALEVVNQALIIDPDNLKLKELKKIVIVALEKNNK
jgi:tetratricopeptide (TPR) repeat protein